MFFTYFAISSIGLVPNLNLSYPDDETHASAQPGESPDVLFLPTFFVLFLLGFAATGEKLFSEIVVFLTTVLCFGAASLPLGRNYFQKLAFFFESTVLCSGAASLPLGRNHFQNSVLLF